MGKAAAYTVLAFFFAAVAVVFSTPVAAAGEPGTLHTQQALNAESPDIRIGEGWINDGFLPFSLDFVLSSVSFDQSDMTVAPGSTVNLDVTVDLKQEVSTAELVKIIEIYRCHDSGCDDPYKDEFIEARRRYYDFDPFKIGPCEDCVGWGGEYDTPTEPGYYAAVGYLWSTEEDAVVSDSPRMIFKVESPEPVIIETERPDINVKKEEIWAVVHFKNTGGDMRMKHTVEMQVRPAGSNPLSFLSTQLSFLSEQNVCDPDHPENVQRSYKLEAGESISIPLETDAVEPGTEYTIYLMTRKGTCETGVQGRSGPYEYSYSVNVETPEPKTPEKENSQPENPAAEIQAYRKPDVKVVNGKVVGTVYFKNTGGAMEQSRIVEMQVRPAGSNPLSFISDKKLCDPEHPENVHKAFKLASGEKASITLSTSAVGEGEYTVYFMTGTGCAKDGGVKTQPYENSYAEYSVSIGNDGSGTVERKSGLPLLPIGLGVSVFALIGLAWVVSKSG